MAKKVFEVIIRPLPSFTYNIRAENSQQALKTASRLFQEEYEDLATYDSDDEANQVEPGSYPEDEVCEAKKDA